MCVYMLLVCSLSMLRLRVQMQVPLFASVIPTELFRLMCFLRANVCICASVCFITPIYMSVHFQHACMCVCMRTCVCCPFFLSSGPSLMHVPHVCVLYAQHYVVVGAGARVLAKQSSCLQQCSLARHCHISCPPCLAVVSGQTNAHSAWAMPYHLLWPAGVKRHFVSSKT